MQTSAPQDLLTLPDRIERAAGRSGEMTFVVGGAVDRVAYGQLHDEARAMAAALQRRGIGPGSHVALLGATSRPFVTAIQAVWLSGATLVILPLPMRLGSLEEFVQQTRARVIAADTDLVVVDPDLAPFLVPAPGDPPQILLSELAAGPGRPTAADLDRPPVDPDSLAVLQFTSGSTDAPKGVMLPHRAVCANLDGVCQAGELDRDQDVLVSWLPLYHDMGLVGFVMIPLTTAVPAVLAGPQDFLGAPIRWMEWLSTFKGTATAGPNFSWVLAARALRTASGLDLSPLRIGLNGAEPVDPDQVEEFIAQGRRFGLRPGAVFPAFGMAEVVIGGTFPRPLDGLRTDCVDGSVLESEHYAAERGPGNAGIAPAGPARPTASRPRDAHRRSGHRANQGRARGRRAPAPRQLGDDRLLQQPRGHGRRVRRGLAPHR